MVHRNTYILNQIILLFTFRWRSSHDIPQGMQILTRKDQEEIGYVFHDESSGTGILCQPRPNVIGNQRSDENYVRKHT